MPSIEQAIQQPVFSSSFLKVQVNVLYTSAVINQTASKELKPFGLSLQQFNVLRILRGQGGKPATIKLLTERMIDKMSNASRLVDKLKEKGLVERQECSTDRRRVDIVITPAGIDIVQRAREAVDLKLQETFASLTEEEATQLNLLLDKLRG